MLNKVMLIGNVGSDPEVRETKAGTKVASFSVATVERWKDQAGEKQERTEWTRISAFGKTVNIIEMMVKKGSKVYVEGSLSTRKFQDRSGVEKTATEVKCVSIQVLSVTQKDNNKNFSKPQVNGNVAEDQSFFDDDDIPF